MRTAERRELAQLRAIPWTDRSEDEHRRLAILSRKEKRK